MTRRNGRHLALRALEERAQPAVLHPLRVALISDSVGPVDQVRAAAMPGVIAVTYDSHTATLDSLVGVLEGVSADHGGAPIGQLGLVAHGQRAEVVLGSAEALDGSDTAADSATWDRLRHVLTPNSRIDLYACDVAAGADGKAFVDSLAARTGSAVYASDDRVGHGGDFVWEYHTDRRPRPSLFRVTQLKRLKDLSLGEDAYEENDTIAVTAGRPEGAPNSPNLGPVTGNVLFQAEMADQADVYRFVLVGTGNATDYASIAYPDGFADIDLVLYDAVGNPINSSGTYALTDQVPLAGLMKGAYFLQVIPKDNTQLGTPYDLRIVAPAASGDDAYEPNDTRAEVDTPGSRADLGTLTGSHTLHGLVLDDAANADWFKFTTAGPGTQRDFVSIAFNVNDGQLDLLLYDAAGKPINSSGTYGPTDQVSLAGLKTGTYYAEVFPKSSAYSAIASYDLQIFAPPASGDDAYEPNDTRAQVDGGSPADLGTVAGPRSLVGLVLDDAMNADWFKFTTTAIGTDQDFVSIAFDDSDGQLDMILYNSAGTPIDSSGTYGPTDQVSLNGLAAGTYYVQVFPKSSDYAAIASYDLQIHAPGTGLSVSDATVVEGTGGTTNVVFNVSLSQAAAGTVTVNFATQDGTADSSDYTPQSGRLTFNPGETTKSVVIPINTDSTPESNEDFFLNLSGATGAVINRATARGTILDDDTAGRIQFSAGSYTTDEAAGTATVFVTRTGGSGAAASVSYTTSDGSATAGQDYTATSGVLDFAAGETVQSFTVPITRDNVDPEPTETVLLSLSAPTGGALLGSPATATLFIQNVPATVVGPHTLVVGADAGTQPRVRVFDGDVLTEDFLAYSSAFRGGVRVATGDVTGDGTPDIVTAPGAGLSPEVKVFDGKTGLQVPGDAGSILAYSSSFLGGVFVAVGDVDKDGHADIITGPGSKLTSTVNVFSGVDGHLLATLPSAFAASFKGGVRVAAGDVDGDGYADVIATTGSGTAVRTRVFSGQAIATTGKLVGLPGILGNGKLAPLGSSTGGAYVAAADLNGDGKADLIIGAGKGAPTVTVLSGVDGSVLKTFTALGSSLTGGVRVATGDVNGDGKPDLIVAPGGVLGGTGAVRAYNGLTYQEIDLTTGPDPLWPFGELFDKGLFVAGDGA